MRWKSGVLRRGCKERWGNTMPSRLIFLCARGSARSLLAASLLDAVAGSRFEIGSTPTQDALWLRRSCRNNGLHFSHQIASCNQQVGCGGMRVSFSVVVLLIPDQSFPVSVGIVSGLSKILRRPGCQQRNNWRGIVVFVMRSRHVSLWSFASPPGSSLWLHNTSELRIS